MNEVRTYREGPRQERREREKRHTEEEGSHKCCHKCGGEVVEVDGGVRDDDKLVDDVLRV